MLNKAGDAPQAASQAAALEGKAAAAALREQGLSGVLEPGTQPERLP